MCVFIVYLKFGLATFRVIGVASYGALGHMLDFQQFIFSALLWSYT